MREDSNISIHVLREEDDAADGVHQLVKGISIHVLREEDDCGLPPMPCAKH